MTPHALTADAERVHPTFMLREALQRLRGRRYGRAAFWYLGPERLVVAVIEPGAGSGDDEPLLTACATVSSQAQTPLAAGLLEAALLVGSRGLDHVAALDERHCRVVTASCIDRAPSPRGRPPVEVAGPCGSVLRAERDVLEWAARVFEAAALRLVRVDCAQLARARLGAYLGETPGLARRQVDPLTAVSVATTCEQRASEIGALLEVPVGLAIGRFLPWLDEARALEAGAEPSDGAGR